MVSPATFEPTLYDRALAGVLETLGKQLTEIAWTHLTFNPWHGCAKIDRECQNCYAERDSERYGFKIWGRKVGRRFLSEANWRKPRRWNRLAADADVYLLVFCASMADVFEIHDDPAVQAELDKARVRLWRLIEDTPNLIWQLLTKRPENVDQLIPARWREQGWPANVWLGTSVGQQRGAHRLDALVGSGAQLKFLSAEPMVDALDPGPWLGDCPGGCVAGVLRPGEPEQAVCVKCGGTGRWVDWVIWGGESGGRRVAELNPEWARTIVRACVSAGIPVFGKQLGAKLARKLGLVFPGGKRNGGDPDVWPDELGDLRRRELPDPRFAA